ncbi:MAG: double-strand break repair helicase AddA [Rickettsiales bacterium]|nr:double-strand break repair helicase AddA [Rickettsiales bacterium]
MNKEQSIASNPNHSVWVTANAGTGKTKVLTDRVLRLLLGGSKHTSILCLTYTKAAASEMFQRITDRLVRWTILSDQELYDEIKTLTEQEPDAAMLALARRLFAIITDASDGIKIQTIHAFCQSLLQRFPLEADITPGFTLIDDRVEQELCQQAKQRLLHSVIQDNNASNEHIIEASNYLNQIKTEYSFDIVIETIIANLPKIRQLLSSYDSVDAYCQLLCASFGIDTDLTIEACQRKICTPEQEPLQLMAKILAEGSKSTQERAQTLSEWLHAPVETRIKTLDAYCSIFLTKGKPKQIKSVAVKALRDRYTELDAMIIHEQERLMALIEQLKSVKTIISTKHFLNLAGILDAEYERMKQHRGYIDYHDVIVYAAKLLEKPGISAWILYKISQNIQHVLIDESQDTSPYQWQLIRHITDDFFHGDSSEHEGLQPTIFVVGDEKQSIYSFQGADTSLYFGEFQKLNEQTKQNPAFYFQAVSMNLSFRTTEAVLKVVDHLFNQEGFKEAVSYQPEALVHLTNRASQPGLVETWPLIEQDKPTDIADIDWGLLVCQNNSKTAEALLARDIAERIGQWLDSKRLLPNKQRPVRAGDIMILVEKRTEFIHLLSRELKQRRIGVAPSDRIKLENEIVIDDLLSLAHFLLLPEDDLSLAALLKTPLFAISEQDLFELAYDRGDALLWGRLKESPKHADTVQLLKLLLAKVDYIPIIELYSYVLDVMGGRKKYVRRLGLAVDDVINEFLALILEYENHHSSSLQQFVDWFESNSSIDIKREQSQLADEVRIMTVHGSKGLQAPIVILADIAKSAGNNKESLVFAEEQSRPVMVWSASAEDRNPYYLERKTAADNKRSDEKLRLLYVAMTRTEDEFYACGIPVKKGDVSKRWYHLVERSVKALGREVVTEEGRSGYQYSLHEPSSDDQASIEQKPIHMQSNDEQVIETTPELFTQPVSARPKQDVTVTGLTNEAKDEQAEPLDLLSPKADSAMHKGIIMHELLQILPKHRKEERNAITDYLFHSQYEEQVSKELFGEIQATVYSILDNTQLHFLFECPSHAEVSVSGMLNGAPLYGVIDRLVRVGERQLLIIDFKTGQTPPKQLEDVRSEYITQMRYYRDLIRNIYPDYDINCAILWTKNQSLMYVSDALPAGDAFDADAAVTEAQTHTQLTLSL